MRIKLKSQKCRCCKNTFNGTLQRWSFTGKDKKGITGTVKGRGKILGACTKCGYCEG